MKMTVKNAKESFYMMCEKEELKVKGDSLYLNTVTDIDIFISILSRYFYTITENAFERDLNIRENLFDGLRFDMGVLIFIRKKLMKYLRSGNQDIDVNDFIKYNLKNINDKYYDIVVDASVSGIHDEIKKVLSKAKDHYSTLYISFTYALNQDSFYVTIKDETKQVITEFTKKNINTIDIFFKELETDRIIFDGIYEKNIANQIFLKLLKLGFNYCDYQFDFKGGLENAKENS